MEYNCDAIQIAKVSFRWLSLFSFLIDVLKSDQGLDFGIFQWLKIGSEVLFMNCGGVVHSYISFLSPAAQKVSVRFYGFLLGHML